MIPRFNADRINFVRFIQENKDIFYELLESGKYNLTRDTSEVNTNHIYEGYRFFKNFSLDDDANVYALTDDLDDFNTEDETDIHTIINEFEIWLHRDIVKQKFEKEYNRKLEKEQEKVKKTSRAILNQIDEIGVKNRTMKRTSHIKDELANIDYFPEDKQNAVKGKTYRRARDEFNQKKIGGKNKKTKKYRKTRRLKRKKCRN
jgi:hypothetical protein